MRYLKTALFYAIAILFVWVPFVMWFKDNIDELKHQYKLWFKQASDLSN